MGRVVRTVLGHLCRQRYAGISQAATAIGGCRQSHNQVPDVVVQHDQQYDVEEVRIPVPYGEVAGKWWGPKNVRPIVCLHGWQDNAGSFDRLIPLLPPRMSFLAIDLPGHGYSSRIPDGMTYHPLDNAIMLKHLMREYHWKQISLMGHSMGSLVSFTFASIFPDMVDFYIGIDALKPHISDPAKIGPRLQQRIPKMIQADMRNRDKTEPPSYPYQDMVDRLHLGTNKSVSKEAAPFLLHRNIRKSTLHPDRYYFTRDSRIKHSIGSLWGQDVNLELGKRLMMPYLFIKAHHSPYYEDKKYFQEYVELLKQTNPLFELEFVDTTHHMHLTEPEKISPIINRFLEKYWRKEEDTVRR